MTRYNTYYWFVQIDGSFTEGDHYAFSNISGITGYGTTTKNLYDQDLNIGSIDQTINLKDGISLIQDVDFDISNLNFWFENRVQSNGGSPAFLYGKRCRIWLCNGIIPGLIWTGAQWEDFDGSVPSSPPANPTGYVLTDVADLLFDGFIDQISANSERITFSCLASDKKKDILVGTLSSVQGDDRNKGEIIPMQYGDLTDDDAFAPCIMSSDQADVPIMIFDTQPLKEISTVVAYDKETERDFEVTSQLTFDADNKNASFFQDDGESININISQSDQQIFLACTPTPTYALDFINSECDKSSPDERQQPIFKINDELIGFHTNPFNAFNAPVTWNYSSGGFVDTGKRLISRAWGKTVQASHLIGDSILKVGQEITKTRLKISAKIKPVGFIIQKSSDWKNIFLGKGGNFYKAVTGDDSLIFYPHNPSIDATSTAGIGVHGYARASLIWERLGFSGTIDSFKIRMSAGLEVPFDSNNDQPGGIVAGNQNLKTINDQPLSGSSWYYTRVQLLHLDGFSELTETQKTQFEADLAGTLKANVSSGPAIYDPDQYFEITGFTASTGTIYAGTRGTVQVLSGTYTHSFVVTQNATIASNKATVYISPPLPYRFQVADLPVTLTVESDAYIASYFPSGFGKGSSSGVAAGSYSQNLTDAGIEAGGVGNIQTTSDLWEKDSTILEMFLPGNHDLLPNNASSLYKRSELEISGIEGDLEITAEIEDKAIFTRIKGRIDGSNNLIEDPTEVIQDYLTDEIGFTDFSTVTSNRASWKFAGSIFGQRQKNRDILKKIADEFALMIITNSDGSMSILDYDKKVSPDHTITEDIVLIGGNNLIDFSYSYGSREELFNRIEVHYRKRLPTGEYGKIIYLSDSSSSKLDGQDFSSYMSWGLFGSLQSKLLTAKQILNTDTDVTKVIQLDYIRDDETADRRLEHEILWNYKPRLTIKFKLSWNDGYNINQGQQVDLNFSGYSTMITSPRYLITKKRWGMTSVEFEAEEINE